MRTDNIDATALVGRRVLIVEDDGLIAMALEDMLDDLGCSVAGVATSVAEALPMVAAGDFDVALIDLHLGSELAMPVAAAARAAGKPFAFASGTSDMPAEFAEAICVAKPYKLESVGAGLAATLAKVRA